MLRPPPDKRFPHRRLLGLATCLTLPWAGPLVWDSLRSQPPPIKQHQLDRVTIGMSKSEVEAPIGCPREDLGGLTLYSRWGSARRRSFHFDPNGNLGSISETYIDGTSAASGIIYQTQGPPWR